MASFTSGRLVVVILVAGVVAAGVAELGNLRTAQPSMVPCSAAGFGDSMCWSNDPTGVNGIATAGVGGFASAAVVPAQPVTRAWVLPVMILLASLGLAVLVAILLPLRGRSPGVVRES